MKHPHALGPLLGHCAHLARERLDARLNQYNVTPAQVHVLHYLYLHDGQAPQCEITAHMRVKPSTANGILDRMAEKELVLRAISEADARKRTITLTEKGAAQQERCHRSFLETEALMMQGLSEKEQKQLYTLLERVLSNLEGDRNS